MSRTVLKSPTEIGIMDDANRIIREILAELRERIRPGMTTLDIDPGRLPLKQDHIPDRAEPDSL